MLGVSGFRRATVLRLSSGRFPHRSLSVDALAPAAPSSKTTLKLTELSHDTTLLSLQEGLKSLRIRTLEIEPGFAVHLRHEAEVDHFVQQVQQKHPNFETRVASTLLPSLMLKNLSHSVTATSIVNSLPGVKPQLIHHVGGDVLQLEANSTSDVFTVLDAIPKIDAVKDVQLSEIQVLKQPSSATSKKSDNNKNRYLIQVPLNGDKVDHEALLTSVGVVLKDVNARVQTSPLNVSLRIQVASSATVSTDISSILEKTLGSRRIAYTLSSALPGPQALIYVRNIESFSESQLQNFLLKHKAADVEFVARSKVTKPHAAMALFPTVKEALTAFKTLNDVAFNGKKLTISFSEVNDVPLHVVKASDREFTVEELSTVLGNNHVTYSRIFLDNGDSNKGATITFKTIEERDYAQKKLAELGLRISDVPQTHVVDLSVPANVDAASLVKELEEQHLTVTTTVLPATKNIMLGFLTQHEARVAKKLFFDKNLFDSLKSGGTVESDDSASHHSQQHVLAEISKIPAFGLELVGLDSATSLRSFTDALALNFPLWKADRSAILKLKRSSEVVPALKALKSVQVDGKRVLAKRFRETDEDDWINHSSYDTKDDNSLDAAFDSFGLNKLLKDYLHTDPATRYQIAKNAFDRKLFDAKGVNDITNLLDNSFTVNARNEAMHLLSQPPSPDVNQRLFDLFLQREDMSKFLNDFGQLQRALGDADSADMFNWSQFRSLSEGDLHRYSEAVLAEERAASKISSDKFTASQPKEVLMQPVKRYDLHGDLIPTKAQLRRALKQGVPVGGVDAERLRRKVTDKEVLEDHKRLVEEHAPKFGFTKEDLGEVEWKEGELEAHQAQEAVLEAEEEAARLKEIEDEKKEAQADKDERGESASLVDSEGRQWTALVVDADSVQKVMPGNRIVSFRSLVVIGDLRGSGGFGTGKSKTASDATRLAFRSALRNLMHVDLYDNFGLAHDLYGKHNSCRVYITATPKERRAVGSHLAQTILESFGITSASVKFVGRRNPYSMVRALFDALSKHENIDETARRRGLRYLTLRWAHSHKL